MDDGASGAGNMSIRATEDSPAPDLTDLRLGPGELQQLRRIDQAARAYVEDRTHGNYSKLCDALFDGRPAKATASPKYIAQIRCKKCGHHANIAIYEGQPEETPCHPDPTGKTREPPHCPGCSCAMSSGGRYGPYFAILNHGGSLRCNDAGDPYVFAQMGQHDNHTEHNRKVVRVMIEEIT